MASQAIYLLLIVSLQLSINLARGERTFGEGSAIELNKLANEQSRAKAVETDASGTSAPLLDDKGDTSDGAAAGGEKFAVQRKLAPEKIGSSSSALYSTERAHEKKVSEGEGRSGAASEKPLLIEQEKVKTEKTNAGSMITKLSTNTTFREQLLMEFFSKALSQLLNQTNSAFFLVRMPTGSSERKSAETFINLIKREMSHACIIEMQDEVWLAKLLKDYELDSLIVIDLRDHQYGPTFDQLSELEKKYFSAYGRLITHMRPHLQHSCESLDETVLIKERKNNWGKNLVVVHLCRQEESQEVANFFLIYGKRSQLYLNETQRDACGQNVGFSAHDGIRKLDMITKALRDRNRNPDCLLECQDKKVGSKKLASLCKSCNRCPNDAPSKEGCGASGFCVTRGCFDEDETETTTAASKQADIKQIGWLQELGWLRLAGCICLALLLIAFHFTTFGLCAFNANAMPAHLSRLSLVFLAVVCLLTLQKKLSEPTSCLLMYAGSIMHQVFFSMEVFFEAMTAPPGKENATSGFKRRCLIISMYCLAIIMIVFGAAWVKKTRNIGLCPRKYNLIDSLCSIAANLLFVLWFLHLDRHTKKNWLKTCGKLLFGFILVAAPGLIAPEANSLSYFRWLIELLSVHVLALALRTKNKKLLLSWVKRISDLILFCLARISASILRRLASIWPCVKIETDRPEAFALRANDRVAPSRQTDDDITL